MHHIEKWAEDRSFLLAVLGPLAASSAQDFSQAFTQLKNRRLGDHQFPLPPLPAWFRLYRSHRSIDGFQKALFAELFPSGPEVIEFADIVMKELRLRQRGKVEQPETPPSPEQVAATKEFLQGIRSDFSQDLVRDLTGPPPNKAEKEAFARFLEGKELVASYFMLVHLPCWLLYQTLPSQLYRKARTGDPEALDKLLRLDPLMLHDPAIGKQLLKLRYEGNRATYRALLEAPLKAPGKLSQKSIKANLAGLLSAIASQLKQHLTEPQIKSLFDAVAKDQKKDPHAIDESLPELPGSFTKAIYLKRQPWLEMMDPDKKN